MGGMTRPPLRLDLRRTDHRPGRLRHPGGPEDRAGAAGRAARPARGGLLLRAGGLGPAALPEGVVRRGGPVAGDAPGAAAGGPGAGADEPGRGRVTPRRSRTPCEPPPAERGRAAAGRHRRRQGGADAPPGRRTAPGPTTAGPRGRRRTRSRWPASGRSTASSRSCGRPRTSSTRCCGTRRPRSGPEPQHKHVWAEMTREVEGEPPVTAKEGLFCHLADELAARNLGHDRPVICLMDGERALWDAQAGVLPRGGGGPGPVPRPGAALGGGALLPQGGERRGEGSSWRSGCGTCCRAGSGT